MPSRVGKNLKRYRTAAGLGQIELARKARIPQSTIAKYETDSSGKVRNAKPDVVIRLAKVLGCTPFDLDPALKDLVPRDLAPLMAKWPKLTKEARQKILKQINRLLREDS